jgi:hypothetical protein
MPTSIRHRTASFPNNTPSTLLLEITSNYLPVDMHKIDCRTTITINRTNDKRRPIRSNMDTVEVDWNSVIMAQANLIDEEAFKRLCESEQDIYVTSDGGVHEGQGTFGVVVSDKAHPLIVNYGKLYSMDLYESSYRSEAYGMLAGLRTLQNFLTMHYISLPKRKTISIFCDIKSLVKRINECRRTRITVNQHCYADVDLELQILDEIKNLTSAEHIVSINHVQSCKKK